MVLRITTLAALANLVLFADTITLRDGRVVQGDYLGGDSRQIRVAVGDRIQTYTIGEISSIRFGNDATVPAPSVGSASATKNEPRRESANVLRPSDAAIPPASSTATATIAWEVPAGSTITVRMIEDVDSERDTVGQVYKASIDDPVAVNGKTVIPRGANVVARLVADKEAGRLSGRSELTLDLVSVEVDGKNINLLTHEVTQQSDSRTGQTGKVVGGGAALGAIIGAIAGGGKGAAIGAVTGAAAGGAVQVLTKGPKVRIPSETRLTFTLQQPLRP